MLQEAEQGDSGKEWRGTSTDPISVTTVTTGSSFSSILFLKAIGLAALILSMALTRSSCRFFQRTFRKEQSAPPPPHFDPQNRDHVLDVVGALGAETRRRAELPFAKAVTILLDALGLLALA